MTWHRQTCAIFAFAALGGCLEPAAEATDTGPMDLTVHLAVPANGYQIASKAWVIQPGEERQTCDIVRIEPHETEKGIWLNEFQSRSSDGSHHMNVLAGAFSSYDTVLRGAAEGALGKSLGQYDCDELGDLMKEQNAQVFYPSQRTEQGGKLPDGVAFPAVVPLVLIMSHHYINTTERPLLVNAAVNFVTVPEDTVQSVAGFIWGVDDEIHIPARSRVVEGATCRMKQDVSLIAISSHTHARGDCFTINMLQDNALTEEPFFVNKDWEAPPILFFEQQNWTGNKVVDLKAGDGVSFGCHYRNDETRDITDGPSAEDEMCIFVALGYPANLTVADVKDIIEHPTVDGFQRFVDGASIDCERDDSAPFAWASVAGRTLDGDEAGPNACSAMQAAY